MPNKEKFKWSSEWLLSIRHRENHLGILLSSLIYIFGLRLFWWRWSVELPKFSPYQKSPGTPPPQSYHVAQVGSPLFLQSSALAPTRAESIRGKASVTIRLPFFGKTATYSARYENYCPLAIWLRSPTRLPWILIWWIRRVNNSAYISRSDVLANCGNFGL